MAENRRRNAQFPDPDERQVCGSELASESSSITVERSKGCEHQAVNSKPGQFMEWTDEKHFSYLKSLEATFVEELNHSMQLCHWGSHKNTWRAHPKQRFTTDTRYSSEQFVVLQDGCWKKMKFDRNENYLDSSVDSHVNTETPGESHFTSAAEHQHVACNAQQDGTSCSERNHLGKGMLSSYGLARSSGQYQRHMCHQSHLGSTAEVSDQNFVEDYEQKSGRASTAKRLKTAAVAPSSK